jgi:hypothetical protein
MPCVVGVADLPMEGEGKAGGGKGGGISCWLLCVLCCCVLSWTILLANQLVEIHGGKVTNNQTLRNCKSSTTTKPPKYQYMSLTQMIHIPITVPHIDMKLVV